MRRDLSGKQDVYIEIAEKFKVYIHKGIYGKGEKLPSVREAACDLGVNPNTVAKAYARLESEGFIVTLPKKGAFVRGESEDGADLIEAKLEVLRSFKSEGYSKETLLKWIEEVYDND